MTTPLDIDYFIGQLYQFEKWVRELPLTKEYRERTTYREFHALRLAKRLELGLTPDVFEALLQVEDNKDLEMAWLELGMTDDHLELLCSTYELDLPLNYRWMPEYEPLIDALEKFMDTQPLYQGVEDEALLEVVRKHMPTKN